MKNHKIHVLGPTYIDNTIRTTGPLVWQNGPIDISTQVQENYSMIGGTGFSYADALNKLGNHVAFSSILGDENDEETISVIQYLRKRNIQHEHMQFFSGCKVDNTLVIIDDHGSKLAIVNRKVTQHFDVRKLPNPSIDQRCLVITSFAAEHVASILQSLPKILGCFIALTPNMGMANNISLLASSVYAKKVDFMTLSLREFQTIYGCIPDISHYVKIIVVTRGKDGHTVYYDGQEWQCAAYPESIQNPIDTNGAGEAFGAAFLSYILTVDVLSIDEKDIINASRVAGLYATKHIMNKGGQFPEVSLVELLTEIDVREKRKQFITIR